LGLHNAPKKFQHDLVPIHAWVPTPAIFHRPVNKNFPTETKLKKNPTLLLVVAAALVRTDGAIFLQKRPEGRDMAGLWEFPGGKLEDGEPPETALARELAEELAIEVDSSALEAACFASAPLGAKNLLLILYICRQWVGLPQPQENQEIGWFSIDDMAELPMPPADLPLIDLLRKLL
jgi:8-oxo-dGTP diphosphatase